MVGIKKLSAVRYGDLDTKVLTENVLAVTR